MKKSAIILGFALAFNFGCACAPNGWNVNVYTGQGKPYYSAGVSGPIPPLKYLLPWNWNKTPQ